MDRLVINLLGDARRLGELFLTLIFLSYGNVCKQGIPVSIAILLHTIIGTTFWELDLMLCETRLLPIKLIKRATGRRLFRQVRTFAVLLRCFSERDRSA